MRQTVYWILVGVTTLYLSLAFLSTQQTDNSRSSCDRGNSLRQSDFDNWNAAADTREETALAMPIGPARTISLDGAAQYRANAYEPVRANERAGVAKAQGSPQVNCRAAYPDVLWLPGR